MKISVFPAAKAHPQGKEEKRIEAFKFSAPNIPEQRTAKNEEELIQLITTHAWSPFVFSGIRNEANFVSTDLLVYDIDEGLTIDELDQIIQENSLCCLCMPSPSHKPGAERFRVILPLAYTIRNPLVYKETWSAGAALLKGAVDPQCTDVARAYFGCTASDGFWQEGKLFEPVLPKPSFKIPDFSRGSTKTAPVSLEISEIVTWIYGEKRNVVPEVVAYFVKNAHNGLPGHWTNTLNAFCFSLTLSGVSEEHIEAIVEKLAPEELDEKVDHYQMKRAISDALRIREEEL